jgi:hypothetical protein
MAIEPHPARITEAIRMASEPAVQRRVFTVNAPKEKFERVLSGLQTLLGQKAASYTAPTTASPRSAFSGVVDQKISWGISIANHTKEDRITPQ